MADSYSPQTVPLGSLGEAAAAGVNLALEDQTQAAGSDIGPTMGMYPVEP